MKKLFFILTFCTFAAGSGKLSAAVPGDCAQFKIIPEIEFTTSYGKLKYDDSYTRRQLTVLGEKFGILEQGLFASGLAVISVNYQVSVNTVSRILSENRICVIPTSVNIFIGYQNPVIYLSNDLKPDTCEYNVVLRHEQTHQQINTAALEYFIPKLKSAARVIVNKVGPVEVDTPRKIDIATQDLIKTYARQIEPLIEYFKNELMKEQGKLDNHRNYQLEGDLCLNYNISH